MNNRQAQRIHPLTAAAAVAVIVVCMLGLGVLTGVLPDLHAVLPGLSRQVAATQVPDAAGRTVATRAGTPAPVRSSPSPGESGLPRARVARKADGAGGANQSGASASGSTASGVATPVPLEAPVSELGVSTAPSQSAGASGSVAPGATLASRERLRTDPGHPRPTLYVNVLDEATRAHVEALAPLLESRGIALVGVKVVPVGPASSDLRYFHGEERGEAQAVRQALSGAGLPTRRLTRISGFEAVSTPHQYELWLASAHAGKPSNER